MHPDRLREMALRGPSQGEYEDVKGQRKAAKVKLKGHGHGANTVPLGTRGFRSTSTADSAIGLVSPPGGRSDKRPSHSVPARASKNSRAKKPRRSARLAEQATRLAEHEGALFDFGRGDALPQRPPNSLLGESFVHFEAAPIRTAAPTQPAQQPREDWAISPRPAWDQPARQAHQIRNDVFKSLYHAADPDLLAYLEHRRVSPFFLREIDIFLETHPELAKHVPDFVATFNGARPLAAYRFFLRGYTKPARYNDGVVPATDSETDLRLPDMLPSVCANVDDELVDFFDGYEYRYDILQNIDEEVSRLVKEFHNAGMLTSPQRKLLTLSLFGNPVDAYKFYEYNYQTEWLPHRYLPEHVILLDLPRAEVELPAPLAPLAGRDRPMNYSGTRLLMARARDQGLDVIDVLLEELVAVCCKRGCRRIHTETIKHQALAAIDRERQAPTGRDIVDMVMGMAPSRYLSPHASLPRGFPSSARHWNKGPTPGLPPRRVFRSLMPGGYYVDTVLSRHARKKLRRNHANVFAAAGGTGVTLDRLRLAKRALEGMYDKETKVIRMYGKARNARLDCVAEAKGVEDAMARRKMVEEQFMMLLVNYMESHGRWARTRCNEVLRRYREGEWETESGYNWSLLQLCPPET